VLGGPGDLGWPVGGGRASRLWSLDTRELAVAEHSQDTRRTLAEHSQSTPRALSEALAGQPLEGRRTVAGSLLDTLLEPSLNPPRTHPRTHPEPIFKCMLNPS